MGDAKKEAGGGWISVRDAADWFVENGSDRELDEATLLQWEEWCADPRNSETYARILEIRRQISMLAEPSPESREDLVKDVLPEPGLGAVVVKRPLS
jgi:ferric-dicitrate binding protein FerR (iron transport regulator)